jgi:phosphoserine aminotransferase
VISPSRRIRYGAVYASSGKNLGPAGVTTVIIRDDLLPAVDDAHAATPSLYGRRAPHPMMPPIMSYAEAARSQPISSIYNTPPTFNMYFMGLLLRKYACPVTHDCLYRMPRVAYSCL